MVSPSFRPGASFLYETFGTSARRCDVFWLRTLDAGGAIVTEMRKPIDKAHIIDEHKRLTEMLESMMFFIENMRTAAIGVDAVDVLTDRLKAHFDLEESVARRFDEQSFLQLHAAHEVLLSVLDDVRSCVLNGDDAGGRRLLATFVDQLERHDEEVDIPMFHKFGAFEAV